MEKEAGGGASWKLVAESKKKKREAIREAKAKAARDAGAPWARERPEGGINAKGLKKLPADYRLVLPDSSRNVDVASGVTCDFPNAKVSFKFDPCRLSSRSRRYRMTRSTSALTGSSKPCLEIQARPKSMLVSLRLSTPTTLARNPTPTPTRP